VDAGEEQGVAQAGGGDPLFTRRALWHGYYQEYSLESFEGVAMRWITHSRRPIYRSRWVELWLDDVEIPGNDRFEHHVLRFPNPSVTIVAVDKGNVLLLWRHRFITDAWGWEVPAGRGEEGEDPATIARRELEEETGWRAEKLTKLVSYNALSGISNLRFISFCATEVSHVGDPSDASEASRVEWIPLLEVPALVMKGKIVDGPSLLALTHYLSMQDKL
jgi:8-oxo-dGTP pyrophosphatase MutT (NUDIX family)